MSYRDQLKIGMSQQEIIEILGDPDHREEMSISAEWQWERVIDDEKISWVMDKRCARRTRRLLNG